MTETEDAPAFLTTREVAALLRVRERKIYEMAAAGEIPCRRLTGKLLFPRGEIEAWLAGAAPADAAPAPLILAGSHDPLLDWAIRESGAGLATFFDGSADGLARMARGEAAAAGVHLFDPESGGWNVPAVSTALDAAPVALIGWATRRRGLLLAPGLEAAIRGVADLPGRRVARRQEGAGGAVLMAHLCAEAGVDPARFAPAAEIARAEAAAAAAVAGGAAEAAPGIEALARQFGLGFAPLVAERFDIAIARRAYFEPAFQTLFAFARTPAFAAKAASLGGYDVTETGTVRWNGA